MTRLLRNRHVEELGADADDVLYHFGLSKVTHDFRAVFSMVKFVCCGGSRGRMALLAASLETELGVKSEGNLSESERFVLYKVGGVLCISHGMGVPSMSVMLVETLKLLHHAGASGVSLIRVGTSGGLGLDPGTVVVSSGAVNGELERVHNQLVLGKPVSHPAVLDTGLGASILRAGRDLGFPVASGLTMCTDDFYEGQGRLDGAFCDYEEADKMAFLRRLQEAGVANIEMEATGFGAFCHRAGVPGAIVCVALVDRLLGDQVLFPKSQLRAFEQRPILLVTQFIRQALNNNRCH